MSNEGSQFAKNSHLEPHLDHKVEVYLASKDVKSERNMFISRLTLYD
jgi:hypothetical protein